MTAITLIPSNDKTHGTYRAEYSGIVGILTTVNILCKQYSTTPGAVTLRCDVLSALQIIMFETKEIYTPNSEHSDIMSSTLQLNTILPIEIKATHILGYQDNHVVFENLYRLEHMKVRIDTMVKSIVKQVSKGHMKREENKKMYPMAFPIVTYKNNRVFDDIKHFLYSLI